MMRILKNIYFQISIINLIILVISNIMIYQIMEKTTLDDLRSDFQKKVALIRPQLDTDALEREDLSALKEFSDRMKTLTQLRITLINRTGGVIADSDISLEDLDHVENHLSREEIQEALMHGAGIASRKSKTIDRELIYYAETIRKEGRIIGFFRTAIFMPDVNARLSHIKNLIFRVDLIFIFMIITTLLLYANRYRQRIKHTRKELSAQITKNQLSGLSYQDDHVFNQLLREMNKTLEWSQKLIHENKSHQERLSQILDSITIGVLAFSEKEQILFVNESLRRIFKITEEHIENQEIYKWIHFPPLISDIENFIRDKTLPELNNTIKYYDESYLEYRMVRQTGTAGIDQIYLLTVRDITRLRQLETIRRDFVANVSHEFKTPLSSIKGFTETLLSGAAEKSDIRIKFLEKIERQTVHLENLVNDILQLARIEKKDMHDRIRINVQTKLEEIVDEFGPLARQANLSLMLIPEDEKQEVRIEVNPDTFHTIISNLLSNAIHYNRPEGKIILRLKTENDFCVIEIEDNGIGMAPEEIERIFERFFRTKNARSIFTEGTGLGLAIVKNAVESFGGRVSVRSEQGAGTIFTIYLPLAT